MEAWLITYERRRDDGSGLERRSVVIHDDPATWLYDRTRERVNHERLKKDGPRPPRYALLFALEIENGERLQLLLQEDE